jgi:RNA polymerase sigma-70 factor (ECF subfamily)
LLTFKDLIKAKAGDPRAIEDFCLDTWETTYRFVYYKVQNREEAEDITQETYVKFLSSLNQQSTPIDNIGGYLKVVALNVIRDKWRRNKRRGTLVNIEDINPSKMASQDCQDTITERLQVEEALAQLKEEQRTILELRIIKGYSVADTAKLIGKSEGAVRTIQHRALRVLSKILTAKNE